MVSTKGASSAKRAGAAPPKERKSSGVQPRVLSPRAPRRIPTVLVVEANASARAVLCEELCKSYLVLDTGDPFAAVGLCMRFEPDLVVASADLPGLDGNELAELVARGLGDQAPPLVLLADTGARVDCVAETHALVLPVAPQMLLDALDRLLGRPAR